MNRDEAQRLLPWFAVGALDADEARAVAAHVEDSPELQRELEELRVLEREVVRVGANEPEFRPDLIDDAWRRIDEYERTREEARPAATSAPGRPGWFATAVEWLRETLVTGWAGSPAGAKLAIAAQFALILVLGGILLLPAGPDADDPAFRTLSGGDTAQLAGGSTLRVVFEPSVTEARIRETLADVGGEIVAGPSPQGSYMIRVAPTDEAGIARVLDELRGRADVVRFAGQPE